MRADNTAHLRAAAAARHESARQRALAALDALQQSDAQPITIAGLAKAANVARSWLYTQPDLLARIKGAPGPQPRTQRPSQASEESWKRRLELAHQRIQELTDENRQLRTQLALAHGQRRADQIASTRTSSTTQTP
ncbi:DUF6262 family protein [Nocardia cyriacigeorgica]|uniref:Transposase n=1 Tax=Nocardia cyriacigeorgica TaxID=135487 RepID=A0A5R8N882_9NOCA|nr:DUF6262 family protein [Nocardia cyriacigeorgica]MBF6427460.1 transposase [Nocardia cyriacigeorgica]TLF71914.1 transposase [Nocardia cyriacigeorgica]